MTSFKTLIFTALLAVTPVAFAAPFTYIGPAGTDVDTNPATILTLNVADFGTITDLTLTFEVSGGSCAADSDYRLFHGSTLATAFSNDGGECTGNPSGTYALTDFNGQEINGAWELRILDPNVPNEGDNLISWSISGNTDAVSGVPEPTSLGLMGLGLVGIGFAARRRKA